MNLTAVEISGADLHSTTNMAIEEQGFALFPRKDFAFDLFIINSANTMSTLMDPNNDIYQDHYRIGLWHWETSKLPLAQGAYGKYYNEIWVPTQFVADAILATESFPAADVKVVVLPYGYESLPPVTSSPSGRKRTHRLQLPHILRRIVWQAREGALKSTHAEQTLQYWADTEDEVTLFLVIFDFNSDYNRKNIIATVRAFLKAFPSDNRGSVQGSTAGLIIKSINAHNQIDDFNRLHWILDGGGGQQQGISVDERVVFFNGLCSESDLEQLKLAASCYVSLHRAEGLGLNLMEAALIGVPVIASAYSGSEQFMGPLYRHLAPELRVPTTTVQVPTLPSAHLTSPH
jgi:glycosyltransferase involved in cell wall biosynthesis